MALGWKLHGDGKTMGPDDVVAPDERLSWGKTIGLGAQHVVAMFGATFVFPLVMGLNPQLAIMMSGIATILLPAHRQGEGPELPRHVGELRRRRRRDPGPAGLDLGDVTGAIIVAGIVLALDRRRDPLPGLAGAAQAAAARRDRRRRHAHRLQPRAGRRRHLLAAGPVGRALDHALHDHLRRRVPRASSRASRSSSRSSSARRCRGCSTRRSGRSTRSSARRRQATDHFRTNFDSIASAALVRPAAADGDRRRRQGGRRLAPAELLHGRDPARHPGRSSRSSPRTPATSRPSPR